MIEVSDACAIGFVVFFSIGPIVQIVKLIRVKNSTGLSSVFYHMNNIGQILSILFVYKTQSNPWFYLNNFFGIAANITILILIKKYGNSRQSAKF